MIDTHAHLDGEEFSEDLEQVLVRAKEAGVDRIFIPNINGSTLENMVSLCNAHKGYLYPMVGFHPEDVNPNNIDIDTTLATMRQWLENHTEDNNTFIAIGEIGLDFYWDDTYKDLQLEVFDMQVQWAEEFDLPLMIHARNAHRELVKIIEKRWSPRLRGVFHCFTGTGDEARELLQFTNFALGIGGVLTFKKSTLPEVLSQNVTIDRIVLETDSPYMAPVPYRGKRNESAFVVEVARKLSELYALSLPDIDKITTATVHRIFGKLL